MLKNNMKFLIVFFILSSKCYHFCGCDVNKQCNYCDNGNFSGYFNMQNAIYPNITNAPNTNGQSCSSDTEYVDVITF